MGEIIAFILAVTFQLSGAVLLLVNNLKLNRKSIVRKYINSSPNKNIITLDEKNKLNYNKDRFFDEYRMVYNNRMSFFYIAIGYLISTFSELKDENKFVILGFIVILSSLLIISTIIVLKKIISNQQEINKDELKDIDIGFIPITVEVEDKEIEFHL